MTPATWLLLSAAFAAANVWLMARAHRAALRRAEAIGEFCRDIEQ